MRIGEVIGQVTLNRQHPSLPSGALRIVVPQSLDALRGQGAPSAEPLIVFDQLGAGVGSKIAFSEGGEAAQPFRPENRPVDAYAAAILDQIDL